MNVLLWDLVLVLFVLWAMRRGYRKGLVLTLCSMLSLFISLYGASILSHRLAQPVGQLVQPVLEESITQAFQEKLEEQGISWSPGDGAAPPSHQLSQQLSDLLEEMPLASYLAAPIQRALEEGLSGSLSQLVPTVARGLAQEITQVVLFLLSSIIILILWSIFSHTLNLAFRLPVLSTVNRWSGALLGLILALLILFLVGWAMGGLVPDALLQQSILLKFFCTPLPFQSIHSFFPSLHI